MLAAPKIKSDNKSGRFEWGTIRHPHMPLPILSCIDLPAHTHKQHQAYMAQAKPGEIIHHLLAVITSEEF